MCTMWSVGTSGCGLRFDQALVQLAVELGLGTSAARQLPSDHASSSPTGHIKDVPDHARAGRELCCKEQAARGCRACLAGNTYHRALAKPGVLQVLGSGFHFGGCGWSLGGHALTRVAAGIEAQADPVNDTIKLLHPRLGFGALHLSDGCPLGNVSRLLQALLIRAISCTSNADAAALKAGLCGTKS